MSIEEKLSSIRQQIAAARARRAGAPDVTLVAVTKYVPVDDVRTALSLGVREIAESRIQEAQDKIAALCSSLAGVRRHLIGHLQTNKAKKAVELFDVIQSVDSLRLAQEIQKHAERAGKIQACLIEVKVSEEEAKHGIETDQAAGLLAQMLAMQNIKVLGLMTMAPYFDDPEQARPYFRKARALFDAMNATLDDARKMTVLSMGMSNDFEVAVEEGSTMVRIGSAIFKN